MPSFRQVLDRAHGLRVLAGGLIALAVVAFPEPRRGDAGPATPEAAGGRSTGSAFARCR